MNFKNVSDIPNLVGIDTLLNRGVISDLLVSTLSLWGEINCLIFECLEDHVILCKDDNKPFKKKKKKKKYKAQAKIRSFDVLLDLGNPQSPTV